MIWNSNRTERVRNLLISNKISSIDRILDAAGTDARMTAIRILRTLDYLSSYSHRGAFYTLREIANFDEVGLWLFDGVRFSLDGSLLNTVVRIVSESISGFTTSELDDILAVETKHAALQAYRRKLIERDSLGGKFLYVSSDASTRRRQLLERQNREAVEELGIGRDVTLLPDELKAAIILFFSLLDEKQRRLYAGLEAAKLGHGGDKSISEFLGLDPHTVAKGRREIFGGEVADGIRVVGGGNLALEKKRPKSSR